MLFRLHHFILQLRVLLLLLKLLLKFDLSFITSPVFLDTALLRQLFLALYDQVFHPDHLEVLLRRLLLHHWAVSTALQLLLLLGLFPVSLRCGLIV